MTFPRCNKAEDADAGFTLLEAVVAFVLFAVSAGAATNAIISGNDAVNTTQDRSTASSLAQADLQQARALEYPDYPLPAAARKFTIQGTTFTLTRATSTICPSMYTPNQPTSMQVTTTVTWPGAPAPVVLATEIAC